ncbi:UNVERIFIED_CONTAM: hypothetical protein GTU68_062712 [Idotea baltica]|nr:hypothetical protein [Idotea baltica]
MPIQMRLPKRGFTSPNRVEYVPINLERLQEISLKYKLETVDLDALISAGIVRKNDKVKILGTGEFTAKLAVTAHAVSSAAKEAIEALGGSVNLV